MTDLISRELFQIGMMFCCGISVMIVFTARDMLMKRAGDNKRLQWAIYLTAAMAAGFLFSGFLYRGSHGVITLYGIMSMTAGILLWKKIIYDIIKKV